METEMPQSKNAGSAGPPSTEELALTRTQLAQERTMMAWTRTGTSLISFGFSIYKFAEILERKGAGVAGAQIYGSAMILMGLGAIGMAAFEHRATRLALRARGVEVPRSLAATVGWLVGLLGILALVLVVMKK